MKRIIGLFLTVTLFVLMVPHAGAATDKPLVVASIAPLASIVQEAFGDSVQVEYIIPLGADPHEYQLTAEQVNTIKEADVIVTTDGHLPVEAEMAELKREGSLNGILLLADDYEAEGFHYFKEHWYNDKDNPHGVWLDPDNAIAIARATEKALEEVDPANAETYRRELLCFEEKVKAIENSYRALITENRSAVIEMPPVQYAVEWLGIKATASLLPEEEVPAKGVDELVPAAKKADMVVYSIQSPEQLEKGAMELASKADKPIAGVTVFWKDKPYTEILIKNTAAILNATMGRSSQQVGTVKEENQNAEYAAAALFAGLSLGATIGYILKK
ncbi:metal ABC transporter solute-binding protein, Zn/Mn family [Thermococcus sp. Bubb.Bath]|uniref:metal ABC transporter solute-binding protein, Zn/Mn family n=1 Tax=Thermococcus sp. Bubb.Bath TaxID=1638242 RepID=UPI0014393867|nr:zinc ABC transporter substrate-binding protein [Thermococcus sp. Bubb.Bath]NJF24695.1 ABC transporter substrate-binding protein [Thermococcus sp. Bubb.Bath]